jgi:hypothetical protein
MMAVVVVWVVIKSKRLQSSAANGWKVNEFEESGLVVFVGWWDVWCWWWW